MINTVNPYKSQYPYVLRCFALNNPYALAFKSSTDPPTIRPEVRRLGPTASAELLEVRSAEQGAGFDEKNIKKHWFNMP